MKTTNPKWKNKIQKIVNNCQEEVKRTTAIGKKMLSASKTNSCLHESLEELGAFTMKAIKSGELEWDHPKVNELMLKIQECEDDLEVIESEVNKIRFAAGPVDVSKESPNKEVKEKSED